jgi:pyruvate formate lyase activating enzyme
MKTAIPAMEIKGFLETSFVDWPGKVCAVLFLAGCNFRCPYCHNHELVLNPHRHPSISMDSIMDRLNSFKGWIDGVCISGGEPTVNDNLLDLMRRVRNSGFLVKLDTNGTRPDLLHELIEEGLLDYVAMDVKAPPFFEAYSIVTGVSAPIRAVQESIRLLKENKVPYEFRTTVIPAFHGEPEIAAMADYLAGCSLWRLQTYNPENAMNEELRGLSGYSPEEMQRLAHIAAKTVDRVAC